MKTEQEKIWEKRRKQEQRELRKQDKFYQDDFEWWYGLQNAPEEVEQSNQ